MESVFVSPASLVAIDEDLVHKLKTASCNVPLAPTDGGSEFGSSTAVGTWYNNNAFQEHPTTNNTSWR